MTQNNNPNSQAANANAATSNNQNPQENATNAGTDNNQSQKVQIKFDDKITVKIEPLELSPIIIQESPQRSITLNLDTLSNILISNHTDSIQQSHTNHILQNIRIVAILYFVSIVILSITDIYLFKSIDITVGRNCILAGVIVLLHLVFIAMLVYCIIYTKDTLKKISEACLVTTNENKAIIDYRYKAYRKLRKLYCWIYIAGLVIYLITVIAALLK